MWHLCSATAYECSKRCCLTHHLPMPMPHAYLTSPLFDYLANAFEVLTSTSNKSNFTGGWGTRIERKKVKHKSILYYKLQAGDARMTIQSKKGSFWPEASPSLSICNRKYNYVSTQIKKCFVMYLLQLPRNSYSNSLNSKELAHKVQISSFSHEVVS